jgi:hypothetical protein
MGNGGRTQHIVYIRLQVRRDAHGFLLMNSLLHYFHLKEEALDRTMWKNRFGRGFGPVVRQTTE